ncbi:conserved hypothetical protein [Candidatus Zixiibacteriota bacterium]|nr:conserved hypothetical protein [candidate division Zixibacteria bacterium]
MNYQAGEKDNNKTDLPSVSIMYQALVERDTAFEGVFYAGVKTTGIFCRPTCPARKPRAENVEFFPSIKEAIRAGYRPCSRCHPLEKDIKAPKLVVKLREAIERSDTGKMTDSVLKEMGIEPSTARRQFQKYYGMTFHAYHRARRMGTALDEIHGGESVIGAQLENGFESSSGFWEAFRQVFGAPPSQAENIKYLQGKWFDTPLGAMAAFGNNDGVHLLEFVDRRGLEKELTHLQKKSGFCIVPGTNPHLERLGQELKDYFDGKSLKFSVPLVIIGTPFEKKVWDLLRTIPPGETWSYVQMARKLGRPTATRAVGMANGRNHLAIVIPCHRVIRADGELCGYGGGIWRKRWLLHHESRVSGKNPEKITPAARQSSLDI